MALRSHLLAGARFGPYGSELTYAADLWPLVPDNALTIVDRNFLSAKILNPLARDGQNRHWLTRAKSDTSWTVVKRLGRGDELVTRDVDRKARSVDPSLPATWEMRAIKYKRPGFRPQTLLTSLLDPVAYPAAELIALYHERWEIELGFDEVKTDMLDRQERHSQPHSEGRGARALGHCRLRTTSFGSRWSEWRTRPTCYLTRSASSCPCG